MNRKPDPPSAPDFASHATRTVDPWRAGIEIGERIAAISPDAVLLFFTIHYLDGVAELIAGLREMLGPGPLLCGGTGDGVFGPGGVANLGVSALAIRGGEGVRFSASLVRSVRGRSVCAAETCAREALASLGKPAGFLFTLADGTSADGCGIVEGVTRAHAGPLFGGLTCDDRRFERGAVLLNDEVAADAVVVLAASGDLPLRIGTASGFAPVGETGRITASSGKIVHTIDDAPATEFFRAQTGKRQNRFDLGIVPLAVIDPENPARFVLRTPARFDDATGDVTLVGRIPEAAAVRVCRATEADILGGVDRACAAAAAGGFAPAAAVIVSCAGRKWLLSESGAEEHRRVRSAFPDLPLAGFPSLGEIGPFPLDAGGLASAQFHNETFVIALFGRREG